MNKYLSMEQTVELSKLGLDMSDGCLAYVYSNKQEKYFGPFCAEHYIEILE